MNNQQAFNQVQAHLRQQNRKAQIVVNNVVCCRLLTDDGCKCAVGCLIPPDQYKVELEKMNMTTLCDNVPALQGTDIGLLQQLLNLHDVYSVADWENRLKEIAQFYNLQYTAS